MGKLLEKMMTRYGLTDKEKTIARKVKRKVRKEYVRAYAEVKEKRNGK